MVHHGRIYQGPGRPRYLAEDVVQADNSVWYTWAERRAWSEKTTAGIPTYGNCTDCYWGGPVGMVCMHCKGKGEEKPIFEVMQVGDKLKVPQERSQGH